MDGLSNLLAVTSVITQLADGCIKLYDFWDSVKGAPDEIAVIMDDLMLLYHVLQDISGDKQIAPSVTLGLKCCMTKITELDGIVDEFDSSFRSTSRRERVWGAIKASLKSKQLKKFRESLSETKSTLMLALMYQNIQRPRLCFTHEDIQVIQDSPPPYLEPERQMKTSILTKEHNDDSQPIMEFPEVPYKNDSTAIISLEKKESFDDKSSLVSNRIVKTFMKHSLQLAVDNLFESGTVEELMNSTMHRMTTFESTTTGDYTSDDYNISTPAGFTRDCQSFDFSRSRVCHQTSSIGVLIGNIWIRTSTLRIAKSSRDSGGNFQIVTSFIFYPASWLTRIGLGHGVEASLRNSKEGWKFDFNPIRAVPDSSLIFELCKIGDVKPVEHLIQRGDASIRDISSKGWTPLHFAAAGGHVDLCASLINMGADKRALVFEGPLSDTLSPITIFAATAHELPAEHKIRMLRLFADCLELSDPSGDGWVVHAELKRAYNKEKVPVSKNSISWLLRSTASEKFVVFGPKTIWHALQHAVRSFLVHERDNKVVQRLLDPGQEIQETISSSHATSIAHWLALRASQQKLLRMVIDAGRFLHLRGFDWVEDDITPNHFLKALPTIYTTWSLALPDNVDKVETFISSEFEELKEKTGWSQRFIVESISCKKDDEKSDQEAIKLCSACDADYSALGVGVVAPAWIAFIECIKTNHKFNCSCAEFLQKIGTIQKPLYSDKPVDGDSDTDVDEEFFHETSEVFYETNEADISVHCEEHLQRYLASREIDPFRDAAIFLYRAQGRIWLNCYKPEDQLCGTCFLLGEKYIGEDGLGTESDFSPMPKSFETFRSGNYYGVN